MATSAGRSILSPEAFWPDCHLWLPSRGYCVSLQPGWRVTVGPGGVGWVQSWLSAVQVMVWNLDSKETVIMSPVKTINCHQDVILSMSFNTNGSLLATACKDRKIRVLDPRAGTVLQVGARLRSGLGSEEPGEEWAWGSIRASENRAVMLSVF